MSNLAKINSATQALVNAHEIESFENLSSDYPGFFSEFVVLILDNHRDTLEDCFADLGQNPVRILLREFNRSMGDSPTPDLIDELHLKLGRTLTEILDDYAIEIFRNLKVVPFPEYLADQKLTSMAGTP